MVVKIKFVLLLILLNCSSGLVHSQNQPVKKPKPYDSWVKTPDHLYRGILYQVQDSSIRISDPNINKLILFNFQDINQVQLRRKNSVLTGAIVGGTIGILPSIALLSIFRENIVGLYLPVVAVVGLSGAAIGTGIGAGIGSIRITIPIERKRENFDRYRSKLDYFATQPSSFTPPSEELMRVPEKQGQTTIQKAKPIQTNQPEYEHESYIGILLGPSFLTGDLAGKFLINGRNYQAVTGYSNHWINIGYRLKGNMGISFAGFGNQYNAQSNDPNEWWTINGFLAGPMWTYSLSKKIVFDLKPRVGYASSALNQSDNIQLQGNGWVLNPSASIRYNFARRWCIFTETGFIHSPQKLDQIGKVNFSSYNLGFGLAYRTK
ncbi:MAG: hypothetical protein JZU47_14070 [Prolixibacteraceae bacterium]|nr:hypothetical protein [Prolixibacteraceae bacterium]